MKSRNLTDLGRLPPPGELTLKCENFRPNNERYDSTVGSVRDRQLNLSDTLTSDLRDCQLDSHGPTFL